MTSQFSKHSATISCFPNEKMHPRQGHSQQHVNIVMVIMKCILCLNKKLILACQGKGSEKLVTWQSVELLVTRQSVSYWLLGGQ